jgi:hypothetical protein
MSSAIQAGVIPSAIMEQASALWEANRLQCGWFLKADFVPQTRDDFLRCLALLAKHGNRETYIRARKLLKCL